MRMPLATLVLAALILASCASGPIGMYQPAMENQLAVRASGIGPATVGVFAPAKGLPPEADRAVSVRGHRLSSPNDSSFAQYLRAAFVSELTAANLLATDSAVVISGQLLRNEVDAGGTTVGRAALGAEIAVTREAQVVFRKTLEVEREWESAFLGAIAIPAAINEYTNLYRKLVSAALDDEGFREALRPRGEPAGIAPAGGEDQSP